MRNGPFNLRGAAAIVALFALSGSLAACGDEDESDPRQVDDSKLVSQLPSAKGQVDKITWNVAGEPDTLDPRNAVNYGSGQIVRNMCEGLLKVDADFNTSPNLASYEVVSNTELRFTVTDDATFWDGSPVTAEDVAYSLQRSAAEDSAIGYGFISVKDIKVTGDSEVTITFTDPDSVFVSGLSSLSGVVIKKEWAEQTGDAIGTPDGGLMCSGPYKLASWRAGSGITLERNDEYWNSSELKPLAKEVDFTFISDSTAIAQALDSGEIDGAYEVPVAALSRLSGSDAGQLTFGPSTQSTALYVARPDGQLADLKLREAFQVALDRKAIADVVYSGAAEPLYTLLSTLTFPNDERDIYEPAYDEWADARAYDLDKAKQFVEESDYDGSEIVLAIAAGDETSSRVAQLVQQQAKSIGVTMKIETLQQLVYDQATYDETKRKGIDMMYGSNFNSRQEPLEPLGYVLLPDQTYNYTEFDVPEVTNMLLEARSSYDLKQKAQMIVDAQEIFETYSTTISLVSTNEPVFLNKRLTGAVTSFAYWSMPQMAYIGAAE